MFDHEPFKLYNIASLVCRRPAEKCSLEFGKNAKCHIYDG